jgi:hypothetical protein
MRSFSGPPLTKVGVENSSERPSGWFIFFPTELLVCAALALAACASSGRSGTATSAPGRAAPPATVSARAEGTGGQADGPAGRCDSLFRALQSGDMAGATRLFDATMKEKLPEDQLRTVWAGITAQVGALKSWSPLVAQARDEVTVEQYTLEHERGRLIATVAVRTSSLEIAGLFFKPAAGGLSSSE